MYYGGIPAGMLAAAWFCHKRNISLLALGDVLIPSLFLGVGFGRIGCFLNGCCYGDRCDLPWGVHFPMGSVPDMALVTGGFLGVDQDMIFRLHPTQLYSSLDGFLLYLLTAAYFPFRPRNGAVIALGALTYPISRFAIESLRARRVGPVQHVAHDLAVDQHPHFLRRRPLRPLALPPPKTRPAAQSHARQCVRR